MNAIEIINTWNALTTDQQIELIWKGIWTKINQGRTVGPCDTLDDVFQSTFEGVPNRLENVGKLEADCKRRESQGKAPNTLIGIVCRAANSALTSSIYYGKKNGKATRLTITDEEGHELDVLDTIAAVDNTEDRAIIRAELRRFIGNLDDTNKKIIAGRIDGLTEREISAAACISNVAVHNRLAKMQKALAEML